MSAKEPGKAAFEAAQLSLPDWQRRTTTQVHYHFFCKGWDAHREQQGAELDRLRAEAEGLRASVLEEAATLVEETFAPMKRGGGRIEVGAAARWAFADAIRALSGPKGQGGGEA